MPNIAQLRDSDPDLQGLDDEQVVDVVHQAYYPDLPREQVASALGVKPPPPPEEKTGLLRRAGDLGVSLARGVVGIPETAVGLVDLATGGRVGKALEDGVAIPGTDAYLRFDPKETKDAMAQGYSPAQKRASKVFDDAGKDETGFMAQAWEKTKALVSNPSVAVQSVVESVPSIMAGGVVGRAFMGAVTTMAPRLAAQMAAARAAPFAASAGARATADALPVVAGAVGEGVVGAGQAAEQIRQGNKSGLLEDGQAPLAIASGAADTLFAMVGGKIAHRLGIADVDTLMVGAAANPKAEKNIARKIIEGFISEGALEELPQSMAEQVAQNLAMGDPVDKDVPSAAVMGFFTGGLMGGGTNAWQHMRTPSTPAVKTPAAPGAAPAASPAPAGPTPSPAQAPQAVMNAPTQAAAIATALHAAGVPPAAAAAAGVTAPPAAAPAVNPDVDPFSAPIPKPQGVANAPITPVAGSTSSAQPAAAVNDPFSQPLAGKPPVAAAGAGMVGPSPVTASTGQQLAGVVPDGQPAGAAATEPASVPAGRSGVSAEPEVQAAAAPVAATVGPAGPGVSAAAVTPEALHLRLARARAAVGEFEAKAKSKPDDDGVRMAHADARDVENAAQTAISNERAKNPAAWAEYDARQQQVAALEPGARVETPDGPGTVLRKFKSNWHVDVDGVGRRTLPPGALKPAPGHVSPKAEVSPAGEAVATSETAAPASPAVPADPEYEKAKELVTGPDGRGSISFIQRHLSIGYNKAAGLLERMEREGIVGPMNDKGQRDVLAKKEADAPTAQAPAAAPAAAVPAPSATSQPADGAGDGARASAGDRAGEQPTAPVAADVPRGTAENAAATSSNEPAVAESGGAADERQPQSDAPVQRAAGIEPGKAAPLYAQRKVLNTAKIIEWAKGQGFKNVVAPDKLHVTLAYSTAAVDPGKVGNTSPAYDQGKVTGNAGRTVKKLGDEGAIVLTFASPVLTARWAQYRRAGASWDFPEYQPHITISYGEPDLDLRTVFAYPGPIELGPELQSPIKPRVEAPTEETAPTTSAAPTEEQPRDEKTGQFAEKDAPAATPQVPAEPDTKYVLPSFVSNPAQRSGKTTKASKAVEAADAARAAYFTPGNVVRGYSGFDEVLAYNAPKEPGGTWSVTVHEVTEQAPNQWARVGRPSDARTHSTQPEERLLKNGPRAQLPALAAEEVPYTDGKKPDGSPRPGAVARSNPRAAAAPEKATPEVSANKLVTDDMAAAARARLKAKLGRLGSGIDPEMLLDGVTLAAYHVEKGARTFAAYAKAMLEDLGDAARPFLKSWYMGVKYDPRYSGELGAGMSTAGFVDEFDIGAVAAPSDSKTAQPEQNGGQDGTARSLDSASAGAPQGAPAADVRAPEGGRDAGGLPARDGERRGGGNAAADAPGSDLGRGLGAGAADAAAAAGSGQRGADARDGGLQGAPRADSGDERPQDAGREGRLSAAPNAPPIHAPQITPQQLADFTIEDDFALGEGGQKTKYRANVEAIKLAKEFMADPERAATADEQRVLARYVGWGGLAQAFDGNNADWRKEFDELKSVLSDEEYAAARQSTRYAHYTSREVIQDGIYAAMRRFGFTGGRVIEGGAGVGNFIGLMPADMRTAGRVTAVEREPIAATIARQLYPLQNVQQADFTEFRGNDGFFDAAVGNPPFASDPQTDKSGRKHLSGLSLHNYFFAKEVDMLREGGILAQVVTNSFLDSAGDKARKYIADRTKFLGAIRLPNNAFSKNAGTEVTTDLIFLQKRPEAEWGSKAAKEDAKAWMDTRPYQGKAGEAVALNVYFHANPQMMLGDFGSFGTMYRKGTSALVAAPGQDTAALLAAAVARLPEGVYKSVAETGSADAIDRAVVALSNPPVQEGGFFVQDGKVMQRLQDLAGEARGTEITAATKWTEKTQLGERRFEQIKSLAGLRATLRGLLAAELKGDAKMEALRKTLNEQYDAYRGEFGFLGDRSTYTVFDDDPDFPLLLSLEHRYTPGIGPADAKKLGIKPTKSTAEKAPIFSRRVVEARERVRQVETPADALAVSMAERGRLDTAYIGELLGKDPEDVLSDMTQGDKPLLFLDPATNEYALRDAYLSGNVRAKLEQAQAAGMSVNARELEKVQPEDVPAHQIAAKIGAPWVPTAIYEAFAKDLFGEGTNASITYQKLNSSYGVYVTAGSEVNASNKWGIPAYSGPELLAAMLNNRTIKVTYKDGEGKTHTDVEKTEMANQKAQEIKDRFSDWLFADAERAEILTRAYNDTNNNYVTRKYDGSWMTFPGKVPDSVIKFRRHQRDAIARIVQDRTALLDHVVGAGKTFTIVAAAMELRRTGLAKKPMVAVPNHLVKQWAADFYRLYPGANILTATKKDFERVNRRRFVAKIATGDWDAVVIAHSSFGFIQPGADFEASFNQRQIDLIMAAIKDVVESDADKAQKKRTVKQLEGMQERLENRIARLRDKAMDDLLDFDELGVDQLFVDEAHMFKNLMYQTKLQNVAGLGDPAGAKRAYDMYVKTQEVMEKNGRGQGLVFATGTPVSNSLAEKYHMMRYLMPKQMEELGFQSFDAWANTYADVRQHWMQKVSGDGFKAQNRMSEFVNVHELLKLFDQVADTVTNDDIKAAYKEENNGEEYPLPPVKGGKPRAPVSLDKSPAQEAYMQQLAARAAIVEKRKGPPKKGEDNHLSLMTDARKAAMDIRLVDLDRTEREKGGRIDVSADNVVARYKQWDHVKGTQLVFSDLGTPKKHAERELKEYQRLQAIIAEATDEIRDRAALGDERAQEVVNAAEDAEKDLDEQGPDWITAVKAALRGFSVYDDLKDALVERGIPEGQIAFIHDYNTDDQKAGLFRKVNSGDIRVLIGSTPKMGAGTNVQERLVALHHLDVPWRPSDVEQREGRIVRQGNLLLSQVPGFEVEVMAYVTKDTLDMRMWQIQEVKLKIINQLRTRQIERNIDNAFEDMEMSASEMQAAATGNMDLLYEIQARNDIKKLENKRRSFEAQKNDLIGRRKKVDAETARLPNEIAREKKLLAAGDEYRAALAKQAETFKVTIDGKEFADWREASAYLLAKTDEKQYTRTVEKDGKKVREEMTAAEYQKLGERIVALRGEGKADDDQELAAAITDRTSWTERAAPLDVTMNGEQYTARAKLAEAFSNIRGDRTPIAWTLGGETINRSVSAALTVKQLVTDALADEKIAAIGQLGPFTVTVEGQPKDKFGNKALDIVLEANGEKIEGYITADDAAQKDMLLVAGKVIDFANRRATDAGSSLTFYEQRQAAVKKQKAELDSADAMGDWPEQGKLEEARAKHAEIMKRLATGGATVVGAKPAMSQEDPAMFQGAAAVATRKKVGELQQAMDAITEEWTNSLPVTVVSSVASPAVPAAVRAEAADRMRRGGGIPSGTIYDGHVWLFGDRLDAQKAVTVLYHEVLGHAGMRGHFGREFDKHLETVAMLRREDVRNMIEKTGMNPADPASRLRAAEEVLAYMAQEKPELTLVQRALALIRSFLRKLPGMSDLQLSDAELIRDFILPARQFVEGGGGPRGGKGFSQGDANKPFYSALSRSVEAVPAKALPVAGWTGAIQAQINKGAVKADEVEWSGIRDWLQLQGDAKVSKQDVLDYLQANGVHVEEVLKGQAAATGAVDDARVKLDALGYTLTSIQHEGMTIYDITRRSDGVVFNYGEDEYYEDPEGNPLPAEANQWAQVVANVANGDFDSDEVPADEVRYANYTLPGGENYRELLLTLPEKPHKLDAEVEASFQRLADKFGHNSGQWPTSDPEVQRHRAMSGEVAEPDPREYHSSHWTEPNIVAHIRFNERTDAEGKKVMFIEELQSDWAQEGRRSGFGDAKRWTVIDRRGAQPTQRGDFATQDEANQYLRNNHLGLDATNASPKEVSVPGVPKAPFVEKTDAWLSLALKRIVKYAADNGFDRVAFVNGKQSADRYDLSKQVDEVMVERDGDTFNVAFKVRGSYSNNLAQRGVSAEKLVDVVGKEVAEKIAAAPQGRSYLKNQDLKIGGAGMTAFYDKIVPAALGKLLPKVGGEKLGEVIIPKTGSKIKDLHYPALRDDLKSVAAGEMDYDSFYENWPDLRDIVTELDLESIGNRDPFNRARTGPVITGLIDKVRHAVAAGKAMKQPGFDVTPAMREKAAGGLPMFAQGFNTRQIQVDGQWRPIDNADGEMLHPTFQGQAEFWRRAGDQFQLDEQGRPRVSRGEVQRVLDGAGVVPMFSQDAGLNQPRDFWKLSKEAVAEMAEGSPGKLHWWHKTLGTQYNLAKRSPLFKRVFDHVQDFLEDVSQYATQAADMAPSILPKLDTWRDILPGALGGSGKKPLSAADNKAIRAPIFEGTLEWTRDAFGNPIRIDDMAARAKLMTADEKAQQMVKNNQLSPNVLRMWRGLPHEQFAAMVEGRYEATALKAGIRWTRTELGNLFDLTEKQKDLYAEFRSSVDESITRAALADMVRLVGKDADFIRDEVMQAKDVKEGMDLLAKQLDQLAKDEPDRSSAMTKTKDQLEDKARRALELMDKGYAPLMRFGHYTVTVYGADDDGKEEVKFFGMYESGVQARLAQKALTDDFGKDATRIERGTMNEESYKLFAGINPETVELFGEMLGMSATGDSATDQAFQAYLKLAKNNRSAMKRMIHRKGTSGFSEDVGRVLAGFTYSTARMTSRNLHTGQIAEAVRDIQLKDKNQGELARQATRLMDYVNNPGEEAQALRGLLFAQYLGGSVASALVNMTQPFQVTMPYLSQYGGIGKSIGRMRWALANAWKENTGDADLDRDMKRAVEEGVVAPQEVHQLMAQARGVGGLSAGDGTATGNAIATTMNFGRRLAAAWGMPFSTAELFNRRVTFAAAYRTAKEQGIANPFEFAKSAVIDTQFLYNKGNRPEWARGALGATLMTFKQYSISYLELVTRMWMAGEPGSPERAAGRRAVFFAAGMILLMGGAGGFPFVDDVEDVIDGIMQRLGYNWQSKQKVRELLQEAFGKAFGGFLEKGVSGFPGAPIDVSGRLGMGNLIPATGLLQKKKDHSSDVLEIGGPTADMGARVGKALNAAGDGEFMEAARQGVPKAMRDFSKMVQMLNTGQYKNERGDKVIDTTTADAVFKGIGFQPNDVAQAQQADSAAQSMVALARMRETEIAAKWAKGLAEHDQAAQQEARRDLAAWNEKNPTTPIRIRFQDILRRAHTMNLTRAQRIEKSAPKEVRQEAGRIMRAGGGD